MDSRISALIKPTLKTKFKVDFEWWKAQDSNWKVYLQSFLCPEHQKLLADYSGKDIQAELERIRGKRGA